VEAITSNPAQAAASAPERRRPNSRAPYSLLHFHAGALAHVHWPDRVYIHGQGELRLDAESLTFSATCNSRFIPLGDIRELGIGPLLAPGKTGAA